MASSSSQPIALPASTHNHHDQGSSMAAQDFVMGSYTGSTSGSFNPASYTRHFLGSPISWRAGSFSSRYPQGSPTAQLLSSFDPNDFKYAKMSSSIDSDRGSLINAFNVFEREGELCRNYTCCGANLQDLHALLEHFEEKHILVVDPSAPAQIQLPFNPQIHPHSPGAAHQQQQSLQHTHHHQPLHAQQAHLQQSQAPFETDDMELELDLDNSTHPTPAMTNSSRSSPSSAAPSPPHTPISAPLSTYPSPTAFLQNQSQFAHHQQQTSAFAQFQSAYSGSAHPSRGASPYASQPSSPRSNAVAGSTAAAPTPSAASTHPPIIHHPHLTQAGVYASQTGAGPNVLAHPEDAFNAYARFAADYSSTMPGTQYNAPGGDEIIGGPPSGVVVGATSGEYPGDYSQYAIGIPATSAQQQGQAQTQCIPPALLFASTGTNETSREGASGPERTSRTSSPSSAGASSGKLKLKVRGGTSSSSDQPASASSSAATSRTGTPLASANNTPAPPSLLLSKPFRCPKPNCNKSYKQANGLKYHMTHGSCNFAPPKDLEHVKDLLERKRREREAAAAANGGAPLSRSASVGSGAGEGETYIHSAYGDLGSITESELREVEREAEKRLKPFACGVGDCQRRYKNMNGLRYHYQHSGDHGAVGLALLAGGLHECLNNGHGHNSNSNSGGSGADGDKGAKGGDEQREGRRRGLNRTLTAPGASTVVRGAGSGGSASMPVSRAGSVVGHRTPPTPSSTVTATPFTPGYTNANLAAGATVQSGNSPPLTPLTAAVQGLGLGVQQHTVGQVHSQPHSPTALGFFNLQGQPAQTQGQGQQGQVSPQQHHQGAAIVDQQQQQQQTQAQQQAQAQAQAQAQLVAAAYQAQFVELQRRQYLQAQAHAHLAQQQQQQQQFGYQQQRDYQQLPQQ